MVDPENWTTREDGVGMEIGGSHTMGQQRATWKKLTKSKVRIPPKVAKHSGRNLPAVPAIRPTAAGLRPNTRQLSPGREGRFMPE
jgi:hypothetical protein